MAEFILPNLGDGVAQGDVLKVLVKIGDTIAVDQPVVELETDKATIEVPSDVAGRVKEIRVKAGDRVSPGQPIAELGNSGNSLGPHLHFHVGDSPKPLGGEGLPYALKSFELMGRVVSAAALLSGLAWTANAAQPARMVGGEMPLENMVVRFHR